MKKSAKLSPDVRERAVRMVQGHRGEYPSLWATVESIAPRIGCVPQTLLEWVKRSEVGAGNRPAVPESNVLRCYAEGLEPAGLYAEDVRQMIGADIGRIVANNHFADNQGKAPGWCLFLHARCLEAMGEH